ncbi:uncharacterized protein DS421_12g374700 [Arachis hypogaea]|nr:uncharacterized protein DS421_12g374700 [Arachis hypogaea]
MREPKRGKGANNQVQGSLPRYTFSRSAAAATSFQITDLLKLPHISRTQKEGGKARLLFVPLPCTSRCRRVAFQPPQCRHPQPSSRTLLCAARTHPLSVSW